MGKALDDAYDRRMWQAIDWRGDYKDDNGVDDCSKCPTDEDF